MSEFENGRAIVTSPEPVKENTTQSFPIPRDLRHLAPMTCKEKTRYALNGIGISQTGRILRATATDGRKLMTMTFHHEGDGSLDEEQILPVELIKGIKNANGYPTVYVDVDEREATVVDNHLGTKQSASKVEGRFPKVDAIIPNDEPEPVETICVNPKYLKEIGRASCRERV